MGLIPKHAWFAVALVATLGCGSATPTNPKTQHVLSGEEMRVVDLTNRVRIDSSLHPLSVNQDLSIVAREQAGRLAQAKKAQKPDMAALGSELAAAGYRHTLWGVNVARSDQGVDDAFIGITKRGPCKVEIMQVKYEDVGVGVAKDGKDYYVVQIFGSQRNK